MQSSFKVSFGRNGAEIITSRMDNVQSTLTFKKYLMRCDTKGLLHKIRTDGIILVWFEDWLIDMEQNRNKLLILSLADQEAGCYKNQCLASAICCLH